MDEKDESLWMNKMGISFNFENMLTSKIGDQGISEEEINGLVKESERIHADLMVKRGTGEIPFMDLPYQNIEEIERYAEEVIDEFDNFVLIGIGGSALGPSALQNALHPRHFNQLDKEKRRGIPRIYILDNVDPDDIASLADVIDIEKTIFNVVTKSGGTTETIANFMYFKDLLIEKVGEKNIHRHIVATTDPNKGFLRQIAKDEGYHTFDIPEGVGGRFSIFTPVGLLPAAVAGIDIRGLLGGAAYMDTICQSSDPWKNPTYMKAILEFISFNKRGRNISVMMPYSNSLAGVADWYCQLWAESLGKKYSLTGEAISTGQTPVRAVGAVDQHSQIQLYVEGPPDKTITFMKVERFRNDDVTIPLLYEDVNGIGLLGGHTFSDLINIEQMGTEASLTDAGRPNCKFILPEITPFTLGQLFYFLEVQTAFAGGLYNINPFDQPGVEGGKKIINRELSRGKA